MQKARCGTLSLMSLVKILHFPTSSGPLGYDSVIIPSGNSWIEIIAMNARQKLNSELHGVLSLGSEASSLTQLFHRH